MGVRARAALDRWRLTAIGVPVTVLVALVATGIDGVLLPAVLVGIGTGVVDTWIARERRGRGR